MKRAYLFAMLGFVIFCIMLGVIALTFEKMQVLAAPATVQTTAATVQASVDSTDESTIEEPTETASVDDGEVDITNYKVHKLPEDSDKWTEQEWEWWLEAAANFLNDYDTAYEDHFNVLPDPDIAEVAKNFAVEVCVALDDGGTLDDIAASIVDSGGSQKAQAALALAVRPGVNNFCPWNSKKLS